MLRGAHHSFKFFFFLNIYIYISCLTHGMDDHKLIPCLEPATYGYPLVI